MLVLFYFHLTVFLSRQCKMKGCKMSASAVSIYFIGTHRISCDDENKVLIIDSLTSIRFSHIQYKLLKPLVENSPVPMSEAQLVQGAYSSNNWRDMHVNLEKHFDHIRSKLRPFDLYVYRVGGYGYVLLPLLEDENEPQVNSFGSHP